MLCAHGGRAAGGTGRAAAAKAQGVRRAHPLFRAAPRVVRGLCRRPLPEARRAARLQLLAPHLSGRQEHAAAARRPATAAAGGGRAALAAGGAAPAAASAPAGGRGGGLALAVCLARRAPPTAELPARELPQLRARRLIQLALRPAC